MTSQRKDDWRTLGGIEVQRLRVLTNQVNHHTLEAFMIQCTGLGFGQCANTLDLAALRDQRAFQTATERGQKGLSVAFDLPTQLGLDADDEMSEGK